MRPPPEAAGEALCNSTGLRLNGCSGRRDNQSMAFFSAPL
jgi:hypothetical protein